MPAILRKFSYQTDASLSVIGSCDPYRQGRGRFRTAPPCEHDAVRTLYVQAQPCTQEDHDEPEYHMPFHMCIYLAAAGKCW